MDSVRHPVGEDQQQNADDQRAQVDPAAPAAQPTVVQKIPYSSVPQPRRKARAAR